MAEWIAAHDIEPVIIDNGSDYPPLLQWYEECKADGIQVIRMNKNIGHKVVWSHELLDYLGITGRYIVTDSDLDLSGVPEDFLAVMNHGLDIASNYDKCALSLEINDLPDNRHREHWMKCEKRYWQRPLNGQYFIAETDTTFALYRENVRHYTLSAIRCNRPYTARHVPWYYDGIHELPPDERYYYSKARPEFASGMNKLKSE